MKHLKQSCLLILLLLTVNILHAQNLKPSKTKFKKLKCSEVYFTNDNDEVIKDRRFYFGQKIHVNFDDVKGFQVVDDEISPEVTINIYDKSGKRIFGSGDEKISVGKRPSNQNSIFAYIEIGSPIFSGATYTAKVELSDGFGSGVIKHSFQFRVLRDKKIISNAQDISFKEAFLFSKKQDKVLLNHEATYREKVFFMVSGIDGFEETKGMVNLGMDIIVLDEEGNQILKEEDLIKESVPIAQVRENITAHYFVNGKTSKSLTSVELLIYDKNNNDRFLQLKTKVLFSKGEE